MNTDNNNISLEDMRSVWQGFTVADSVQAHFSGSTSMLDHRSKLMRQQKALIVVAVMWALLSMPLLCLNPAIGLPLWAGVILVIYFVLMGIMSIALYHSYKDIDMCTMSVRECMAAVLKAKTLRRNGRIVGMIVATPVLGYLLWFFYQINKITFVGAVVGAVFGLFIGLIVDLRMRRHLREMARYLESLDRD
ncbi:MAG: hypothetical protein K2O88_02920 [Paramuribaculum sp.]|nr:hypothetical protein [Paramuribaculum sp.]